MTDPEGPSAAFEVRFTAAARRSLNTIPPRVLSAVVEFTFGDLAREPRRVGKPLRDDLAGLFSARRGPYRVLYRIDDAARIVFIVRVDHRADVYRP
ncbi:MAG: type II toxin-antitoxin system RelE/ParE family toxin [Mycobacterium sp.]